jgi:hypothetical protein
MGRVDKSVAGPVQILLEISEPERPALVCLLPVSPLAGEGPNERNKTHFDFFPVDENYFPYTKHFCAANRKIFYFNDLAFWKI